MERALVLPGGGARGAFQAGVLRYLDEVGWKPELICGTSVGSINAAAIGSGMSMDKIIDLWKTYERKSMFKLTVRRFLLSFLSGRKFEHLSDTGPLRKMLEDNIDVNELRKSDIEIIISAVNMATSELQYFNHRMLTLEHIMASSAMPMLFPWQDIEGVPYWDGGVMANIPIGPALERKPKLIIVALLSPVGAVRQPVPRTHHQVAELIFEHFLIGSYQVYPKNLISKDTKIAYVAPSQMLGIRSMINFSKGQAKRLLEEGYTNARRQLKGIV
ncbi:patatin-like phospholipase family protein [Desulfobacterales bacterium HSG16]|nr:patatin-like phospholipase family protein [Desulfobacterales bacterium HSG16]